MFGLKIFVRVQTFRRVPPVLPCNFCHPGLEAKKYGIKGQNKNHISEKLTKCLNLTNLHEDDDGDDGVAHGEDAPEHPDRLAVAHELVRVVVRSLPVLHLRLHGEAQLLASYPG